MRAKLTNKCTIRTKTSSLFPKQGVQNAKRTEKHTDNERGNNKKKHETPRSVNYRATQNKNNIRTTALERSVVYTLTSLCIWAGRFESYLVANTDNRFFQDVAQIFLRSTCICWFGYLKKRCAGNKGQIKKLLHPIHRVLQEQVTFEPHHHKTKWVCAQQRLRSNINW